MTTTCKLMKSAIPAAVFAFGVASASAGQAATYVLQNGAMDHGRTMTIAGIGSAKAAPIQFDGYIDDVVDKPFTNLVAFCVDVYHRISLGDYNPDLTYTDTIDLTTDSNFVGANILLKTEILQIGRLVNYGTNVFYKAPVVTTTQRTARWDELAAVQGAIWQVVSGRNVTHNNGFGALDMRVNALGNALTYNGAFNLDYGTVSSKFTLITPFKNGRNPKIYPHRDLTQSFAISAAPEPATWALMIGGFGLAGAMLRRSRRQTVHA